MSMPSASYLVQTGAMEESAAEVSRQERPCMLPESSIKKIVSNWERKLNLSSAVGVVRPGTTVVDDVGV